MSTKIDFVLILSTLGLLILGMLTIYSSGNFAFKIQSDPDNSLYIRQLQFLVLGVILLVALVIFDYQKLAGFSLFFYIGALVLLILVLLIGDVRGGARSWFGFREVGIQPSELSKVVYIIAFAKFLDYKGLRIRQLNHFLLALMVQLPLVGLILIQPDPGTALVYFFITWTMLFVSHAHTRYLVSLLGIAFIAMILGIVGLEDDFVAVSSIASTNENSMFIFFAQVFNQLHDYVIDTTGILFVGLGFLGLFLSLHFIPDRFKIYFMYILGTVVILNLLLYIFFPSTAKTTNFLEGLFFGIHARSFMFLNLIPILASIFMFQYQDQARIVYLNKIKHIFLTFGLGFLLAMMLITMNNATDSALIKPHIIDRFTSFLGLTYDYKDIAYDTRQNMLAIGSGGWYGQGFTQGPHGHNYVTERSTDYAFTVFAEDMGFIWVLVLFALFALIFYRSVLITFNAKDYLGSLIAAGVLAMFAIHFFINVGMCVGIMPIIGIPLFFVSYGGSNLVTAMAAIGLLLNVESRKHLY